jgi:hypothetical protein
MGLYKKLNDPGPSGGDNDADPDPQNLGKLAGEQVRSLMADHRAQKQAETDDGHVVDPTALIMGGAAAGGRIDSIKRALNQNEMQHTFDVQLTVFPEDAPEFTAHIVQPVAEDYLAAAAEGQKLKVKYDPDDHKKVWIDWAASLTA